MPIKISGPAPRSGWDKNDHEGHLALFVHPVSEVMTTTFGEAEAARCAYAVCLDEYVVGIDPIFFGKAFVPRLVDGGDGAVVVGRLVLGEAKPGRNAPWLLEDPTEEELATAQKFMDTYGSQAKSGAISLDVKAIERDAPTAEPGEKF